MSEASSRIRLYTSIQGFWKRPPNTESVLGLRLSCGPSINTLRLYEDDGLCHDCRVPAGTECYFCWDERRTGDPGQTQDQVDQKIESSAKYKDQHSRNRVERVQGARKQGQEGLDSAVKVESAAGAFKEEFDEGHFYDLESWLSIHCSGQSLPTLKSKLLAVQAKNQTVVRDQKGELGVNTSLLPPKAKYKWKSGTKESFKKVTVADLDDAEEADDFLAASIARSSLQLNDVAGANDTHDEDDAGDEDDEYSIDDVDNDDNMTVAQFAESFGYVGGGDGLARSRRGRSRSRGSRGRVPRISPNSSRASSKSTVLIDDSQPAPPTRMNTPPRGRNAPVPPSSQSSVSKQSKPRASSAPPTIILNETQEYEEGPSDGTPYKGRKRAINTFPEGKQVFEEYKADFNPLNMYNHKFKLRDVTQAVDRLRKIGNKVACMDGDEAADLAGKLVVLADWLRPMYDLMDMIRIRPWELVSRIKPDQVSLFASLPYPLQHQLLSSIALSILGKLPNSTTKADDVHAALEFISGHKYSLKSSDDRVHLGLLAQATHDKVQASFEKAQNHVVVVLLEALLKLQKVEFVKIWRKLRSEGLAPTLGNLDAGKDAWSSALAWTDISVCSCMAFVLESQEVGFKKSRLFFEAMTHMKNMKQGTSIRLKTFRGAKKSGGDGDIGRFAWEALDKITQHADGPTSDAVQAATANWTTIKEKNILPLGDDTSVSATKECFIAAYNNDLESVPLLLAQNIAQAGTGTEVSDLIEAEVGLQLGMARHWELLEDEVDEDFVNTTKALLAGDIALTEFNNKFVTSVAILQQYDDVTLELNPRRAASVAISELRERLTLAGAAFNLHVKIHLDPVENLEAWAELWKQHLKIQNTRPNAEFVLESERLQSLLTTLRGSSLANLIQSFINVNMDVICDPSTVLVSKAQNLKSQLPELVSATIDRAGVLSRISRFYSDKSIGRTLGPCELTALKAEASILKGFEHHPSVKTKLESLDSMWKNAYTNWVATARFDDFAGIHTFFEATYNALLEGNISGHEWLETVTDDTEIDQNLKRYQECLLRALPVKVAASSMAAHVFDEETAADLDQILTTATDIVGKARTIELVIGSVAMANTILAKPRAKTFSATLAQCQQFVKNACKVKDSQLPKYVQTLLQAETAAKASSASAGAGSSAAAAAASASSASSGSGSKKTEATGAEAKSSGQAWKKIKLS